MLYECLTGRVPFLKDVDAAVIWAHVEEPPTPPSVVRPELPRGIDDVIARALAKDPNDRYPTAHEFVNAARAALEVLPQSSATTSSEVGAALSSQTVLTGGSAPRSMPLPSDVGQVPGTSPEVGESQAPPPGSSPPLAARASDGGGFGGVREPSPGTQPPPSQPPPSEPREVLGGPTPGMGDPRRAGEVTAAPVGAAHSAGALGAARGDELPAHGHPERAGPRRPRRAGSRRVDSSPAAIRAPSGRCGRSRIHREGRGAPVVRRAARRSPRRRRGGRGLGVGLEQLRPASCPRRCSARCRPTTSPGRARRRSG